MACHPFRAQEPARNRQGARDPAGRAGHQGGRITMKIYRRIRADMNIEKFKPAIVYTIYIASTPQQVWQALTSAEFSRKYFFGNAVQVDLRVGGAYFGGTPARPRQTTAELLHC